MLGQTNFFNKWIDQAVNIFTTKLLLLIGFNSSEIKIQHLNKISEIAQLDRDNIIVIDGGANIGEFTTTILEFSGTAKVLCIEPQIILTNQLETKFRDFNVSTAQLGLSNKTGKSKMYFSEEGDRKASLGEHRDGLDHVLIEVATLEEVISEYKFDSIDILKLDLEGMDSIVLEEFFKSPTSLKPKVIILEVSFLGFSFGFSPSKTFRLLERNGYREIYRTSPILGLIPVSSSSLYDYQGHTVNWVGISR